MADQKTSQEWQTAANELNAQSDALRGQLDDLDKQYSASAAQFNTLKSQQSSIKNTAGTSSPEYKAVTSQINAIYTQQDQITNQKAQLAQQITTLDTQAQLAEVNAGTATMGPPKTQKIPPPGGASPAGTSSDPTSVPPVQNTVVPAVSATPVAAPTATVNTPASSNPSAVDPATDPNTNLGTGGQTVPASTAAAPVNLATDPNTNVGAEGQTTDAAATVGTEDPFEAARLAAAENANPPPTEADLNVPPASDAELAYLEQQQAANREVLAQQAKEVEPGPGTGISSQGVAYDDNGNLMPGWTLDENNNPVYVGGNFVEPATAQLAETGRLAAQKQQTLSARQNRNSQGDWRVRIHLAPGSDYLYNAPTVKNDNGQVLPGPGILAPLAITDGVIFPYTPTIETSYQAKYQTTDLTHSNYRGYYYQSSHTDTVTIRGTFTAQDSSEAQYLLAVIHFFRSVTKMFYGQDQQAGTPPPLVFISGLGQYQFNKHPCVVTNFSYSLPNDVDYIRADGFNNYGVNLENRRSLSSGPAAKGGASALGAIANKLGLNGLSIGGLRTVPAQGAVASSITNTTNKDSTYVPTKMEISVQLLPIQTRSQMSQQFSAKAFANGNLLKGGFW